MGRDLAETLANHQPLDAAIAMHLSHNHYPPVPSTMVQPCINAINAVNEGDYNREINLEGAAQWRGQDWAPAHAIVRGHHLEPWINQEEGEE